MRGGDRSPESRFQVSVMRGNTSRCHSEVSSQMGVLRSYSDTDDRGTKE